MDLGAPTDVGLLDWISLPGLPFAAAVLIATWFVAGLNQRFFVELGDRFVDRRLLLNQVATLLGFAVWIVGFTLSTAFAVHLTDQVVLALTGTIAVTVGFAFKDLAASILAGLIILVDRPFQVGDRVAFADVYGEIRSIGLRSVRLVTLDDNVVTIPNNKFLTDVVSSGNWGELDMLVQVDFHIDTNQDVALAKRLVSEAMTSTQYAYTGKPWSVSVAQLMLAESYVTRVRAKVYVLDVVYEKALETDLTERVAEVFRRHQIRPPA